jgi:hypothetical protein
VYQKSIGKTMLTVRWLQQGLSLRSTTQGKTQDKFRLSFNRGGVLALACPAPA